VSYNVKYFLEQGLSSVHKAIRQLEAEVWVVDNASADNSIAYLKPKFPWVNFIENDQNLGFGKANNLALYRCKGEYILFLNPDTIIAEDSLVKCIQFLRLNSEAGALGIRMIDGSGTFLPESKRAFPSPLTSLYKLTGLSKLFPASKVFSRYALGYLSEYKNHEVDVLSGAFMLAKKDLLLQLKGFDEAFFMYGEDIDLSYRFQKAGYKNYYFSESTIIHFKGESTRKNNLRYVRMFYQAMSIFVKKHYAKSSNWFASGINIVVWLWSGVSAGLQIVSKTCRFLITETDHFFSGKQKKLHGKKKKAIIVGTEEEYEEVKALLVKAGFNHEIIGRVSTDAEDEGALGVFSNLEGLVERLNITEIIFCNGSLSYTSIIDKVQNLGGKVLMRFHSAGTKSIVGSDSKETAGEYIA
jgi:GT2 family glycosyltransferase